VVGLDQVAAAALFREGPELIGAGVAVPLLHIGAVIRVGAGDVQAFVAVLGNDVHDVSGKGTGRVRNAAAGPFGLKLDLLHRVGVDGLFLAVFEMDEHVVPRQDSGNQHRQQKESTGRDGKQSFHSLTSSSILEILVIQVIKSILAGGQKQGQGHCCSGSGQHR